VYGEYLAKVPALYKEKGSDKLLNDALLYASLDVTQQSYLSSLALFYR
jgi:hypothetical protein